MNSYPHQLVKTPLGDVLRVDGADGDYVRLHYTRHQSEAEADLDDKAQAAVLAYAAAVVCEHLATLYAAFYNHPTNSQNILSKQFTVLITYEE